MKTLLSLPSLIVAMMAFAGCASTEPEQPETAPADWNVLDAQTLASSHGHIDFEKHVKPILTAKCVVCHNHLDFPQFSMETRRKAFEGGPLGKRIIPGNPDDSALIIHITSTHKLVEAMPPVGERLTADEIRILTAWIKQGAYWPSGKAGNLTIPGTPAS